MKQVVAALIVNSGERILICQRTRHQPLPLKWEFPGGKIEDGEQAKDALRRELEEELGIKAEIGSRVVSLQHHYKNGNAVELHFFAVHKFQGEVENRIFEDIRWVAPRELAAYDFLDADKDLVNKLATEGHPAVTLRERERGTTG